MASPTKNQRRYPEMDPPDRKPERPISFIVVRFSGDYEHNFLASHCIRNPLNEVVTVDNRSNLFYDNLSQAISAGIERAKHELIAIVHEDVLLSAGWQARLEASLETLESIDPNWGVVGSVGWLDDGAIFGHWSDPYDCRNTFKPSAPAFQPVKKLDEQLLVFHRDRLPEFDSHLPGIHLLGEDLILKLEKRGLTSYVVDAPTIHKFADSQGEIIQTPQDSPKINDRMTNTYQADYDCCMNYFLHKWPHLKHGEDWDRSLTMPNLNRRQRQLLDRPLILLSRGGSGSRLLSQIAQDAGIWLGSHINKSGDSMEMVSPIYRALVEKYKCHASWQKAQAAERLRVAAAHMIDNLPAGSPWGFKLPESILLLPELLEAFPHASFLHLVRDPLTTCLRRTHMTARLDNHIGRIAVPLAYDAAGISRRQILQDSPAEHMAYTTLHQVRSAKQFLSGISAERHFEVRFEDLIWEPSRSLDRLCEKFGLQPGGHSLADNVNPGRAANPGVTITSAEKQAVKTILEPLRREMGYLPRKRANQ